MPIIYKLLYPRFTDYFFFNFFLFINRPFSLYIHLAWAAQAKKI